MHHDATMIEDADEHVGPQRWRLGPSLRRAVADLRGGVSRWELWTTLGWQDIRHRYRRSTLGPFWITLSMAAMIGGIGLLYAGLFGYDLGDYLPFLACGLILWGVLSDTVVEGCSTFIKSGSSIRQIRAPLSVYLFQMLWKSLLVFAHNIILVPIILLIFGIWPGAPVLLALVGFTILYVAIAGMSLTLGLASARYRDLPPIVEMVVRFTFFFTPILWKPETLTGARAAIVTFNPFHYLLEVTRAPLLGEVPPLHVWLVAIGLAVVSWIIALAMFARVRHRVAFWV